jgi:AcrR family transcriptional regulator
MTSVKPVRRRDRESTRASIVDAARTLFRDQGYARTTITDIARVAGVAPQTVYWAFGSKPRLVTEIRDAWLRAAGTGERLAAVLGIEDGAARLDAYATFMTHQWETGSDAVAIQEEARRVDADVARDVTATLAGRAVALLEVVRPLGPQLRAELTVKVAHDRLLALSSVGVYLELRGRGWTADAYRDWLSDVLRSNLLDYGNAPTRANGGMRPGETRGEASASSTANTSR